MNWKSFWIGWATACAPGLIVIAWAMLEAWLDDRRGRRAFRSWGEVEKALSDGTFLEEFRAMEGQ